MSARRRVQRHLSVPMRAFGASARLENSTRLPGIVIAVDENRRRALIVTTDSRRATLNPRAHTESIPADFDDIENCTPKHLAVGENVSFEMCKAGNKLSAKCIRILVN